MYLLIVLLAVGLSTAVLLPDKPYYDLNDTHNLFKDFVEKYNRDYSPEEYLIRLEIFKETLKELNERNADYPNTVFEITHFADLMKEERSRHHGMMPIDDTVRSMMVDLRYPSEQITAPVEFDWRDHGVVTPVKNQNPCWSCYIFSTIGNIEGQYAIKHKKLLEFSEQECLDCPISDYDRCLGGYPHEVMFSMINDHIGLMLENDYPYQAKHNKICSADNSKSVANLTGFQMWTPDEETLKQLLVEIGPLSVGLDASDLHGYKRGILKPKQCSHFLDHAVLLVGYGVENGEKYWTLKNSYGEDWGEKGYFRLLRGVNACSMGTGYTATVTVA